MEPLTPRQRQIYNWIADRIGDGYPPTLREIGTRFGIASTNGVTDHLKAIARKGWIRLGEGKKSRGIRLVAPDGCCPTCGAPRARRAA